MSDIAEVFSDAPAETPAPESSEAPEAVAAESTSEVSAESEASTKVETEVTEPTSETEQKAEEAQTEEGDQGEKEYNANEKALYKQAKDERKKRQERDERIAELEAKLAQNEQGENRPDVFEDQEGYTQSLKNEFNQELKKAKLDVQREMMVEFKPDYPEVEAAVIEEMRTNPVLKAELQRSENVAKAVYEYGKKLADFNEAKGFDKEAYTAKLKAEIKAELEKEYQDKAAQSDSNLSPSLANARGSNNSDVKAVESLSDVFA